ncbi:hypothetical protein [Tenacibaculum xiamenense]|uniref:hypothetical protein n=1 Tax=Tenacibaculum xiamenense TaxID=1261553 RepID=UPI0038939B94
MSDSAKTKFTATIIAITGLLTAIGGVITVLHNVGFLNLKKDKKEESKIEIEIPEKKKVIDEKEKVIKTIVSEKKIKKEEPLVLSGYWWNKDNRNGKYYIESNSSGNISFTEYSLMYGQWISTATGTGSVKQKNIDIPYTTYLGTSGKFTGKVVDNGKEIHGSIHDFSAGMKVILNLIKEE